MSPGILASFTDLANFADLADRLGLANDGAAVRVVHTGPAGATVGPVVIGESVGVLGR
jgi:hypothetical protein